MDIEVVECKRATVVSVSGEVDVATAPELDEKLATVAASPRVVVDLSGVTFLDSSGLGVLIKALKRVKDTGGSLVLVITEPRILKVFTITGLDKVLTIVSTVDAALDD